VQLANHHLEAFDVLLFSGLTHRQFKNLICAVKKLFDSIKESIRTHLAESIAVSLLCLLGTLWKAMKWQALHLSLSDTEILTIRATLIVTATVLIAALGWPCFFRARKANKALAVENLELKAKLEDATKPNRAPDPFAGWIFQQSAGVWTDKTTHAYCPVCKDAGKVSPMQHLPDCYYCAPCDKSYDR
jgi:hypothetical protein